MIVLGHVPGQFRWIAKKELFNIPIFGAAMRTAGYIEIDRNDHEKAMQSMDEAALRIREGKPVMTFPEGTRSRDGEIKPFKQGTFHLALKSGVPICRYPSSAAAGIIPKRSLKVTPGKVKLIIGEPVDVTNYTMENRQELINKVRDIIIKNYDAWKDASTANIKDLEGNPLRPNPGAKG